jgi:hypothetical protein
MPPTIGAAMGFITSEPTPVLPQDRHQTGHHGGDGHEFGTQATNRAFNRGSSMAWLVSGALEAFVLQLDFRTVPDQQKINNLLFDSLKNKRKGIVVTQ